MSETNFGLSSFRDVVVVFYKLIFIGVFDFGVSTD